MHIDPETEFLDERYSKALIDVFRTMDVSITEEQAQTALGYLAGEMTIKDEEEVIDRR